MIFDDSWEKWLETNLNAGYDKKLMYNDMIKAGFKHDFVLEKLEIECKNTLQYKKHVYTPGSVDFELYNSTVKIIDNFLSEGECLNLQILLNKKLEDRADSPNSVPMGGDNEFINDIDEKLCDFLGIRCDHSSEIEGRSILSNKNSDSEPDFYEVHPELGYCSLLVFFFLNEPPGKNQLRFPEMSSKVEINKGALVIWENLSGRNDHEDTEKPNTIPIPEGYQSILFKKYYNHWSAFKKTPNEYTPAYTRKGFLKNKLPDNLFFKILSFYYGNINTISGEIDKIHIKGKNNEISSEIIELSDELKIDIHKALHPIMEAWIGRQLEPTFVFGIRRYLDTSVLKNHRDREETHVASAILNIAQDVRKPWPLYIEDHHYNKYNVFLNPGEMILYEGCKLKHGRPEPLDGNYFCNIFVHFKIKQLACLYDQK